MYIETDDFILKISKCNMFRYCGNKLSYLVLM